MALNINTEAQIANFVEVLTLYLPDSRDARGKKHSLVFLVVAFVLATIVGRNTLSSIHRYIVNNLNRLHELTGIPKKDAISRAHLPRLLARLNWSALDQLINHFFGIRIEHNSGSRPWLAIDGKVLRGTLHGDERQSVILAVMHKSRDVVAQARQIGPKSSEILVVRTLLEETGLNQQKISLDALHFNPETTTLIHQSNGVYLTQVKENQEVILHECQSLIENQPVIAEVIDHDKAHGRITTRHARIFSMATMLLAPRWEKSGLSTCIVMERETFDMTKKTTTSDTSYYVSSQVIRATQPQQDAEELTQAIRNHWGVESNNWIRDVTFQEDKIKTNSGHQGQIMARLRGFGIALIKKSLPGNFQAAIDTLRDSFPTMESMLRRVKFL